MSQFTISPAAKLDIMGIWTYFADEIGNVELADRFAECAEAAFSDLARSPAMGRPRRFRRSSLRDLRSWRIKEFRRLLVFYREIPEGVEIVRVLHGARNLSRIFLEPK